MIELQTYLTEGVEHMTNTTNSQAGSRPSERRPSDVESRATGSYTATTPEEQLAQLQAAWSNVKGTTDELGTLLPLAKRAEMAVEQAGLAHTPQRALQLLGIHSEPKPWVR
jgi:hypothetical protein